MCAVCASVAIMKMLRHVKIHQNIHINSCWLRIPNALVRHLGMPNQSNHAVEPDAWLAINIITQRMSRTRTLCVSHRSIEQNNTPLITKYTCALNGINIKLSTRPAVTTGIISDIDLMWPWQAACIFASNIIRRNLRLPCEDIRWCM